jgi:hypothetical protein
MPTNSSKQEYKVSDLEHMLAFRKEYFKVHDPQEPMADELCEIAYHKFLERTIRAFVRSINRIPDL